MYEKFTIRQFINARWGGDNSIITNEQVAEIETEYISTAKLYESEEFHKVSYISYLNGRVNSIKMMIRIQKEFLNNFDIPFKEDFNRLQKKYGYILRWNNDKSDFIKQLDRIESSEIKYEDECENCLDELIKFRLAKRKGEDKTEFSREGFIKTINMLRKIGWHLDKEHDTVEDLALTVLEQINEQKKR